MFKVCARTVLELGAELISSDVIAFYELIKNGFDAGSPNGVEVHFEVVLRRNEYLKLRERAQRANADISQLKADIDAKLDRSAPEGVLTKFRSAVDHAQDCAALVEALDHVHTMGNKVTVSDTGTGMSQQELIDNYLVIGTASRKRAIDAALAGKAAKAPYLGEKGIGRLSAMRLGGHLTVKTARKDDKKFNLLKIDWSAFDSVDAMVDEVDIQPSVGKIKPTPAWSGTRLIISHLASDWTQSRVESLVKFDFARLIDPFEDPKNRPRVAIFWNGGRIPIAHMERLFLDHAHATVKGKFFYKDAKPVLKCTYEAKDLGFSHPCEKHESTIASVDLEGAIAGKSEEIPASALDDLGEFEFEAYWYNRQRLAKIDSIGDRSVVRAQQKHWSGILLFRDGFRVLPYGDHEDDWLKLDRKALGSSGYLLNRAQLVGRVTITRLGNPWLVDQTNREGLRDRPEKQAFVEVLNLAIQDQFRQFLQDMSARYKGQPLDLKEAALEVPKMENRALEALKKIRKVVPQEKLLLGELQAAVEALKKHFDEAKARNLQIEAESRQMIQVAGVGLMVEVVAHELARATENSLAVLGQLKEKDVPTHARALLNNLKSEMKAVSKRLRVLDPLSVSGRQRKEVFRMDSLIEEVLDAHVQQFKRHEIHSVFSCDEQKERLKIRAVKGMMVQIFENLVSNSIYWLDLRRKSEKGFQPEIKIHATASPLVITYEDNGRGIARDNRDKVFAPFFSLKEKSNRRGLGLYIARDCAEHHGGMLTLDDEIRPDTGRLHRFVLELPKEVLVP